MRRAVAGVLLALVALGSGGCGGQSKAERSCQRELTLFGVDRRDPQFKKRFEECVRHGGHLPVGG